MSNSPDYMNADKEAIKLLTQRIELLEQHIKLLENSFNNYVKAHSVNGKELLLRTWI